MRRTGQRATHFQSASHLTIIKRMKAVSRLSRFHAPFGDVAFVSVVAATYLALLISAPGPFAPPKLVALLAAGLAYAVLGTIGFARCQRAGSLPVSLAYFAVQIALAALVMLVSRAPGLAALLLMPLAAHAAILPRGWMLIVCVCILAVVAALIGLVSGWQGVLPSVLGYLTGVVFVVGFTQVALREARARIEVERLAAELREANDKLRQYAVQAEELATIQERNRLAREIHDGLGHYLTAISMQLQAARAVWESDLLRAADALGKAQTLTREALTDVRRSVAALRATPTEDHPLPEALTPLVEESRAAGIETELTVSGAPRPLSPQTRLALYRAAQEGLTNVRKHAQASRVDLVLDYSEASTVRLIVRDDGVGAQKTNGGFGLIGLRERVQYLRGELRTQSIAAQGFALEVKVPG